DQLDRPMVLDETVDPKEIAKFTALAEEWWKPNGKFRTVHEFNALRRDVLVAQIAQHFGRSVDDPKPLAGLSILDVGCGAGLLAEPLAALGATVVGIDATARNIEIARWHAAQSGIDIDYRHCLTGAVVDSSERFDVVLNMEVIEHVDAPRQLMAECCALVAPGGLFVLATLNRTIKSFVIAIVGAEYVLGWLPRGTHDWRRFITPVEVEEMIAAHGFRGTERVGAAYSLLQRRWRQTGDDSVNYIMMATRPAQGEAPQPHEEGRADV
ncbi:MAG: bifunctional 2-polyprenyl-6-hydroxyphenol methylase/3-demethylubiquinol 3-O-methyltransferase UbiG, partial [Rhodospirillaceae bacterium]